MATTEENADFDGFDFDEIRLVLSRSGAKKRFLILDCCFSGNALDDAMGTVNGVVDSNIAIKSTYSIASAPPNRLSIAEPGEQYTAFSGELFNVLESGTRGPEQYLSANEIFEELQQRIRLKPNLPTPRKRSLYDGDKLVIARNKGALGDFAQQRVKDNSFSGDSVFKSGGNDALVRSKIEQLKARFADVAHDLLVTRLRRGVGLAAGIVTLSLLIAIGWFLYPQMRERIAGGASSDSHVDNLGGILGHWTFDEGGGTTVADSSGNGNTGTIHGSPHWESTEHGKALTFNGRTDYVTVGNSSSLNPTNITVSLWIKLQSVEGKRALISRSKLVEFPAYGIEILPGGVANFFVIQSQASNPWVFKDVQAEGALSKGIWYHLVATWNGTDAIMYVNGIDKSTANAGMGAGAPSYETSVETYIGKRLNGGPLNGIDGTIRDFRIYDRALTAEEVRALR